MTVMNMRHSVGEARGALCGAVVDVDADVDDGGASTGHESENERARRVDVDVDARQINNANLEISAIAETESQSQEGTMIEQRQRRHSLLLFQRTIRCFVHLSSKWPRLFAIIFKVVIPLFSLIMLSMIFGYWLAQLEAPGEIRKNNMAIAVREALFHAAQLERVVMRVGPSFCVDIYLDERMGIVAEEDIEDYMLDQFDKVNSWLYHQTYGGTNNTSTTQDMIHDLDYEFGVYEESTKTTLQLLNQYNVSKIDDIPTFLTFIADCGRRIDEMMNHSSVSALVNAIATTNISSDTSVTFNWIKCPVNNNNGNNESEYTNIDNDDTNRDSWTLFLETFRLAGAGVQEKVVVDRWRKHHYQLYTEYYSMYYRKDDQNNNNITRLQARDGALLDSSLIANGFEGCIPDTMSAAWFWFVVMTTIGYGNASPSSTEGRTLVFTFGFLCILLFGTVLATAGDILTTIFDDAVRRKKRLKWLSKTWVGMIFWGVLFYLWLYAIAATTVAWKKLRLGQEFAWNDAYWFSFVSITTVGLGDFFLEHEAIAVIDVVSFAMLFLIGFVLLANFLFMLKELPRSFGRRNGNALSNGLEDQPTMSQGSNE